jgi:hypothetical protein
VNEGWRRVIAEAEYPVDRRTQSTTYEARN